MLFSSTFIILVFFPLFSSPFLNPLGPTHAKLAVNCLEQIAKTQFTFVDHHGKQRQNKFKLKLLNIVITGHTRSPTYEIQQNLIRILNLREEFNIGIVDDATYNTDFWVEDRMSFGHHLQQLKTAFYIFIIDSVQDFWKKIQISGGLDSFNPRALVMVYFSMRLIDVEKMASRILQILWNNNMFNSLVVLPQNLRLFRIYRFEYNFVTNNKCFENHKLATVGQCNDGKLQGASKMYEKYIYDNFEKCQIDVIAHINEPFVLPDGTGFEIDLLELLGNLLHVDFNITIDDDDVWGEKGPDGEWTDDMAKVYREGALGIGNFMYVYDYLQDFGRTFSHYRTNLIWIVPLAQTVPKWRVLTIIFSWDLWLICLGVIIATAILLFLTASKTGYKRFGYSLLVSFQVIITNATYKQPVSDGTRLVFLATAIFSIIISSVYTSSLINYLTNPVREHQIHNFDEIIGYGLDVGGLGFFLEIFNVTEDPGSMYIYHRFEVNDSADYWWRSVADDRDTATMVSEDAVKYMIAHNHSILTKNGKSKVFLFDQQILSYGVSIVYRKGFPLKGLLNKHLERIVQSGLVFWMLERYTSSTMNLQEDDVMVQPLSLDNLQGAFSLLIMGYFSGGVSFVGEVFVWGVKKLWKKRAKKKNVTKRIKIK